MFLIDAIKPNEENKFKTYLFKRNEKAFYSCRKMRYYTTISVVNKKIF